MNASTLLLSSLLCLVLASCAPGSMENVPPDEDGGSTVDAATGETGYLPPDPEFPKQDAAPPKPDSAPPAPDLPRPDTKAPSVYGSACAKPCGGSTRVMHNAKYGKWIKVVRCSPQRYDLLMGSTKAGPFYKIGDGGGHGQDHCELVNPSFTITNDDTITSGSCKSCKVKGVGNVQGLSGLKGSSVYHRSSFGKPFKLTPVSATVGIHTSCWYECGVSL